MIAVLLGAGFGLLVVGLATLGYGILIKDFSFGNALITSGAVAACSGLIICALWVVARELQNMTRRLGAGISVARQPGPMQEPALAPPLPPGDLMPGREQPIENSVAAEPAAPPWPVEPAISSAPPPPPAEAAPQKPRRNLLFTSSSRKERERAASRAGEPLAPDLLSSDLRPSPSAAPPPAPEPGPPPPPPSFEDAWPKAERARPGEAPPPRRTRTPPPAPEVTVPPPAPREPAPSQVTVLKSGVVDGMAYSLYSDGSIEAQMPEGMMRFASIDELRAHLDQRP
jgi:hypothetical protein